MSLRQSVSSRVLGAYDSVEKAIFPGASENRRHTAWLQRKGLGGARCIAIVKTREVVSSVPLQMALYWNVYYSVMWAFTFLLLARWRWFHNDGWTRFAGLGAFGLWAITESSRLLLGYLGNLKEKVPHLVAFFFLTFFPQLFVMGFLVVGQKPLLTYDLVTGALHLLFLFFELGIGVPATNRMIVSHNVRFQMEYNLGRFGTEVGGDSDPDQHQAGHPASDDDGRSALLARPMPPPSAGSARSGRASSVRSSRAPSMRSGRAASVDLERSMRSARSVDGLADTFTPRSSRARLRPLSGRSVSEFSRTSRTSFRDAVGAVGSSLRGSVEPSYREKYQRRKAAQGRREARMARSRSGPLTPSRESPPPRPTANRHFWEARAIRHRPVRDVAKAQSPGWIYESSRRGSSSTSTPTRRSSDTRACWGKSRKEVSVNTATIARRGVDDRPRPAALWRTSKIAGRTWICRTRTERPVGTGACRRLWCLLRCLRTRRPCAGRRRRHPWQRVAVRA